MQTTTDSSARRRPTKKPAKNGSSERSKNGSGDKALRELRDALRAAERGDFSVRMRAPARAGVMRDLAETFNAVAARNELLTRELVRVEQLVGREGRMTERVSLGPDVTGGWSTCVGSANALIADLMQPTTEIARVIGAVARGDLGDKMSLQIEGQPIKGEFLRIGTTVNAMVDQLNSFAAEVTRVAREVGTDGKLGGQARVEGVSGTWKDLTDNVNLLANNLTSQVRNIAEVTTAVAKGDLSKKITVDARGEVLELKNTVNTMVDQLNSFAAEVTRVAKDVGTEGKLGGQAEVVGVSGTWKDLTDNVNSMAANLTTQVRGIVKVVTAVANGDLSQRLVVDAKGEVAALADTLNAMTKTLSIFAEQVTSVAKTVGVEGKLGAQAEVPGVAGTWKDLTDNVNLLANNLTSQVRNIAEVTTAVARGDLSRKISVEARGEVNELKNTINTMVDQLRAFAAEVTRVAKEVGTDGKLGGQAEVEGVSGTWRDLTDNVNVLAANLTDQVRNIAKVTTAVANGDLSQKITVEARGEVMELKNTINTMVDQLRSFAAEVTRVAKEVGTEGKLGGQAEVQGVSGTWKDLTDNVNSMAANLTQQVRNIAKVTTAVANGDLSQTITVAAQGEVLELKDTINTMVDQLNSFASEVTRVAREVGTEGELGGQAEVKGVAGVWKNLTDNVNFMARNLTTQVRGIVKVVTAVANGDLSQKLLGVEAKGEIAALADTINAMTDTLRTFAEQVSSVAHQVGVEGKLGGQAKVPGATGTWRQLTDNVNQLAGNLTTQVRAIQEVATAVTKGDLTQNIDVVALGEVAQLKDNINQMIFNLRETTLKNQEQDWLKSNLARFSSMMQGQKNLETVSQMIMSELTPLVSAHQGAFFTCDADDDGPILKLTSAYAYRERKNVANRFRLGEGLVGQCALEKKPILLTRVPSDYIQISSGLGEAPPLTIIVLPVLFEGQVKAVIELASFQEFSAIHQLFLDQLTETFGVVINMITANMRTEELLQQSQGLTQELQSQSRELTTQQDELKRSNAALEKQAIELEVKARLLEEQNTKVEIKNREVEHARLSLEEKAEQLALISKYKSEFLANMSHELRTPLNSLLILARLLADNQQSNLTGQQVEYAKTIYASGGDLLALINEILDLSKVEAGKMQVDPRQVALTEVQHFVDRNFRPVAEQKGLEFVIDIAPEVAPVVRTDPQRLQQVLKNLLANAFKFTERGKVELRFRDVHDRGHLVRDTLLRARHVVAFEVGDTGIGIASSKQRIIFEAFQQADGTTSRRYGGTGLGLSISREIARLLGGEIHVESTPGKGSVFTLYLPDVYVPEEGSTTPVAAAWGRAERPHSAKSGQEPRPATPLTTPPVLRESDAMVARAIDDDSDRITEDDRVLLVVEDDVKFARIMVDMAREQGYKAVVASRGDTAVAMANDLRPAAITLDIHVPVIDGWEVLGRLKRNPRTRHIPVRIISIVEQSQRASNLGAFGHVEKPVSREALVETFEHMSAFLDRRTRRLLVVEDDQAQRDSLGLLLGSDTNVEVSSVANTEDALARLAEESFDCIVIDLLLPGEDGFRLIEQMKMDDTQRRIPIVVYTGKELTSPEEQQLERYADAVVLKRGLDSPERLAHDVSLFLHQVVGNLSEGTRAYMESAHPIRSESGFSVLVVDDDVRNIFAMTSVLESNGVRVVYADNGRAALESLERDPSIDLVLMDIMMPEMDGYETIQAIRADSRFASLPIIAITAKALPEDRDRCIQRGASDYLPKPVDTDKLLERIDLWARA